MLVSTSFTIFLGSNQALAQMKGMAMPRPGEQTAGQKGPGPCTGMQCITTAQRKAAAARVAARRAQAAAHRSESKTTRPLGVPAPGGTPDYFGIYPNYANSPLPTIVNGVPTGGIRKFVDSLPGVGLPGCDPASTCNANNLGNYIPIAVADEETYPGSDYYQIGVFDYTYQFHSDLPNTTSVRGYRDLAAGADGQNHYLGPLIVAQRDKPVRVKFVNNLGLGSAGNLFIPVDMSVMGAGMGPDGTMYTENRATLHLHGGNTPWISDGTPHQWITPAGETATLKKGLSFQNVPDMAPGPSNEAPSAGDGIATFYWTNQQSSRMMFYHDHSYGITRLNVYAGEVAGYLLWDQYEEDLISGTNVTGINSGMKKLLPDLGGAFHFGIPLVIQDKTFVPQPSQLAAEDPTWDTTHWGGYGNLWFPHVYMPNQNPADPDGVNAMGRWDYGPWFWPPISTDSNPPLAHGAVSNPYYVSPTETPGEPPQMPGTPNISLTPESYMDTPLVNGQAYPYLTVSPRAYRFRILNGSNDRSLNLQVYYADPANPTEMKMVPAVPTVGFPPTWPTDARDGGVPDPATAGPPIIQIGTEGGFLPAPAVIPATPIGYEYNRRSVTVLNAYTHALLIGPAERADVIIDFSSVPSGSTLILYNDSPTPIPGFDSRLDYYTGDEDQTEIGGAPSTLPGYGPNTRTILQFRVSGTAGPALDLNSLNALLPAAYAASQPPPIVPEVVYGRTFGTPLTNTYSAISSNFLTYTPPPGAALPTYTPPEGSPIPPASCVNGTCTVPLLPKAIQELFELNYGRMNAILGVELPFTNANTQTTIPLGYIDPITETLNNGDTQIWKITHNGVDTHFIHFHLFNVQVINRVGWDGTVKPPDPNEVGWKETVRMNPLEDTIVALKPLIPSLPFEIPTSLRPPDVTSPPNATIEVTDPVTGVAEPASNAVVNYGWEYVWHCHILGHEENDMMRPIVMNVPSEDATATAVLTNPWPGTNLPGTSTMFVWTPGVGDIGGYELLVGTTGVGSSDLFVGGTDSSPLSPSTGSQAVSGLPADGSTIYVRLATKLDGDWSSSDYTYNAAKSGATVSLASSLNPAVAGQSVTLTATVSAVVSGTPAGTVNFLEGGVVLGASPIANGTASIVTSRLATGLHLIVAQYAGSSSFESSTSGTLNQTVNPAYPDFTLTSNPASGSGTVAVGSAISFTVTLTPVQNYSGTVTFSCDTAKSGLSCTALPGSVTVSGQPKTVALMVSVSSSAALTVPPKPGSHQPSTLFTASLGVAGLLGALLLGFGRKNRSRNLLLLTCFTGLIVLAMSACSGVSTGSGSSGTSPLVGQQTVTLYANGGGVLPVSHQLAITFTVQQ